LREATLSDSILLFFDLAWSHPLDKSDFALLQEVMLSQKQADADEMLKWIGQDPAKVALFLYLYDILDRHSVSNSIGLLNGLQVLQFDPEIFKSERTRSVLKVVRARKDLYATLVRVAESTINLTDISRFIKCLSLETVDEIGKIILTENSPLLVVGLCTLILQKASERGNIDLGDLQWASSVIDHPIFKTPIQSEFTDKAQQILRFFFELKCIADISTLRFETKTNIRALVNWYQESSVFSLELNLALAKKHLNVIEDVETQRAIERYLDSITSQVYTMIEAIDLNLAELIQSDVEEYLSHPMLSTNLIGQNIIANDSSYSANRKLWVLIFDGMRFDTWEVVLKSIVAEKFEIHSEKLYLSPLPSYTQIARTSLLAGSLPPQWADYATTPTIEHVLASRLFGLSKSEGVDRLQITNYSETDVVQKKLNESAFDYNVLVYNVSDDLIHSHKGDIAELNDVIKNKIVKNILPDLYKRIKEQDTILLTSDHGFQELERSAEILIADGYDEKAQISPRFIKNIERPEGIKISYNDTFYTVAKSRDWFKRKWQSFSRYAHGGISMNEMVVPAVLLKKIVAPTIKGEIESPKEVKVDEDAPLAVSVVIKNEGNHKATFVLDVTPNVGRAEPPREMILPPNESVAQIIFSTPMATRDLKSLALKLSYLDANGRKAERSTVVLIAVKEKKDKVEISVGKELDSLFDSK
jgi:hypothetical protein